jgi:iron complex outermembrane receptor protein
MAAIDGSYLDSHQTRLFRNQPFVESVGQWNSRDLYLRWKHQLRLSYALGDWTTILTQQYASGYADQRPAGTPPDGFDSKVDAYSVVGVNLSYGGIPGLSLSLGIKNLFDRDPPFTAHNVDFAAGAGWDPRVADPRGRAYTLRASYRFL